MDVTIFHNPRCGTSRNTLALLRDAGHEPVVVDFAELGLDAPATGDEALLDAMLAHPILINRPFVVTPKGVRLCRPAELVREIL